MKTARSVSNALVATLAIGLLIDCGASARETPATAGVNATGTAVVPREPAPDLTEVPMPDNVVAVVRTSSLPQLADRAGQLSGLGGPLRAQVEAVFGSFGHALGAVIDRNAPVDVLVVVEAQGEIGAVLSFGTASVDEVERVIGREHRLLPMGNGARRIEPIPVASANDPGREASDNRDDESQLRRSACVIAPTPIAGQARLLCAERLSQLEGAIAFASRTLPRHDVSANTVTVDVPMESLRARYLQSSIQQLDDTRVRTDSRINAGTTAGLNDPVTRTAFARLANELLDALHSLLVDPTRASSTLTLTDTGASLHVAADLRGPSSGITRAVAEGTRGQPPVPAELLSHLLPDGWLYAALSTDARTLAPTIRQVAELGNLMAQHDSSLTAADRTAMTAALDGLSRLDQIHLALAVGNDANGQLWMTATAHNGTLTPAHLIPGYRSIIAALRRPNLMRMLRTALHPLEITLPELGDLREIPTRGLPAGTFGFRVPSLHAPTASASVPMAPSVYAAPASRPPRAGHSVNPSTGDASQWLQVLLVPDGASIVLVVASDARARYTRYHGNATPGIDPRYITAPNATAAVALIPAGTPNLMRASSPAEAQQAAAFVAQLSDHGRTPVTVQLSSTESQGLAHFATDIEVPRTLLRGLADFTMRQTSAAANPCAAGNPCGGP